MGDLLLAIKMENQHSPPYANIPANQLAENDHPFRC